MRNLLMAILVLCAAGKAMALTPLGPPRAGLKQKQHSMGLLFGSSEMDLKVSGYGLSETMKDTESTAYLMKAGYGLSDDCELYTLLGMADLSFEEFNGSSELAWGFGAKFTVAEKDSVTWGGMFQFCHISSDDTLSLDVPPFGWQDVDIEAKIFDIQIAFGPTYTKDAFSIYGGPFLHFVDGDLEGSALGETVEFDIEQKSEFGGYVGMIIDSNGKTFLFIEYQKTGDASAIAGGIVFRF